MSNPVRLHKEVKMSLQEKIEQFLMEHATLFLTLAFIILMLLVVMLCAALLNGSVHASMTDSNTYYYHLEDVI